MHIATKLLHTPYVSISLLTRKRQCNCQSYGRPGFDSWQKNFFLSVPYLKGLWGLAGFLSFVYAE